MSRRLGLALTGLLSVAAFSAILLAQEGSSSTLGTARPAPVGNACTNFIKVFDSTGADGAAIANPRSWSGWGTGYKEATANATASANPYVGGRMYVSRNAQQVEVLVLFSTAGANATFQLFAAAPEFDEHVPSADRSVLDYMFPTAGTNQNNPDANLVLGPMYPIGADTGVRTFTITATADAVKLKQNTTKYAYLYPNESGGTTYYVGARQRFDASGFVGWMPYVTSISAGTVIILIRAV